MGTSTTGTYNWIRPGDEHVISVTTVEPDYQPGEVYRDPGHNHWIRNHGRHRPWTACATGATYPDDFPERPLVHLVPETP